MLSRLYQLLPADAVKILLVLFLSFLVGLEREEHKAGAERYTFGGVRTFPIIGLIAYSMAVLSGGQLLPVAIGFIVVGGFLLLAYWHKLISASTAGVTTELSGLAIYIVGALIYYDHFWIATALAVASALLLELKTALEGLTKRFPPEEILTFTKFLLLSAVILPILPNQEYSAFRINPFKTWLVVVAVSAISYGSYVLQKVTREHGGVMLAALLGDAYSSTLTTVVLAKRAAHERRPHLFAGATLMASGVMYLRLAVLLVLFNRGLANALDLPFLVLAGAATGAGWLWSRRPDETSGDVKREYQPQNPLEMTAAFLFAALFIAMLIATHLAVVYLGRAGVYSLAGIMGVTDVDPFIMGMTQAAGTLTRLPVASAAILIAAASNNVIKGIYAWFFARGSGGAQSLALLIVLALAGLVPLVWVLR
ncbi:MAG TPA: MgtC/SapB family protein [Terriglobia bacterium]|nr:MgtC/SapB family protein [Terriglobia bacterium]